MYAFPGPNFEDVVFKLINFNGKLSTYEAPTDFSLHQAFYTNMGGYSSRGRAQNIGGSHGRGNYSTQGRGFIKKSVSQLVAVLPMLLTTVLLAISATSLVILRTSVTSTLTTLTKPKSVTTCWLLCELKNNINIKAKTGMRRRKHCLGRKR